MQEMVSVKADALFYIWFPTKGRGAQILWQVEKEEEEKRCQNVCYILEWIYGLRMQKSNNYSCTHNTPHTNNLHISNGTLWFNLAFYAEQYVFWEFTYQLRLNHASQLKRMCVGSLYAAYCTL